MKSHCFRLSLTGTADTWWAGNYHRHWKLGFVWRPEIEPYRLPSRKSAIRIKDHTLPYNNFWRRSLPSTYRSVWMDAAGAWTIFSPNDCGEPWSMKIFFEVLPHIRRSANRTDWILHILQPQAPASVLGIPNTGGAVPLVTVVKIKIRLFTYPQLALKQPFLLSWRVSPP